MSTKLRALLVEDSEQDTLLLARELERAGYDLAYKRVETAEDLTDALAGESWDIIFGDYTMPRFRGTEALNLLNKSGLDIPFIFVSGTIGEATAVDAMRHGAKDYILKGNLQRLVPAVERELREAVGRRERKRAEEALRASEQKYQTLAEVSPVGIFQADASGKCLYVNKRWCEIAGLRPEEVYGEGWARALHPEDRDRLFYLWNRAAKERLPFRSEYRFRRADGVTTWVFGQATSLKSDRGEILGYVGTITDITELKKAEESLESRNQELQTLHDIGQKILGSLNVKEIAEGILEQVLSLFAFDLGVIRIFNPNSKSLTPVAIRGYRRPEAVKEHSLDSKDPTFGAIQGEAFAKRIVVVVESVSDSQGLRTLKQEGCQSAVMVPIDALGRPYGTIVLANRKRRQLVLDEQRLLRSIANQLGVAVQKAQLYEEMTKLASDLARSNRVKDDFLSVMSHELRTPLSVITGYAGMMKERMMGEITPMQDEALRKMLSRAADQINMINSIMQTTQLEARAMVVERHPADLTELLLHLKSDYAVTQEKTGVTLIWDYPAKPAPIVTDGGKVRQILQNLIDNALKFTDRGSVTIFMRLVKGKRHGARPAADDSDKSVECRVTDTGVGIAPDKLQLIFDKFYQIDSSETRLYGGVGLGLYIVKNFTALLGGQIEVESEPGVGSAFTVTLPLSAVSDHSQADQVHRLHAWKKGKGL
jgi:two-component system sensor histidine kinase/response regulator